MNEIRYLLDENVNPILRSALLRENLNLVVWQVGMLGVPAFGTLDPETLIWCEENEFLLVTNNRKFISRIILNKIVTQPEFLSSTQR